MATVEDVLKIAEGQVGYEETGGPSGHDGNITKYWKALDEALQGQPWCACFQVWVDKEAKAPHVPVQDPYYCPSWVTYARNHGLWSADGHYKAGDIVFYDFTGHGLAEHCGRVVSDNGESLTAIEGNTLPQAGGNQADGGGVYKKVRLHGPMVMGVLSYDKLLETVKQVGQPPRKPLRDNPFKEPDHTLAEGAKGDGVKWVQWAVGVPVDGVYGSQTKHGVAVFQQNHHACDGVDGIVGPKTRPVLAKIKH